MISPQYQQETDGENRGDVAKYLAIPVPNSPTMRANVFRAFTTLLDENRYIGNSDPYQDNDTSQWHENHYAFWIVDYILGGGVKIAIVQDVKPPATYGGTFTAGAWRQRDLNTSLDPFGLVTVSGNAVTILQGGNYYIRAVAPACAVFSHQARLAKNGVAVALGTITYCNATYVGQDSSVVAWVGSLVAGDVLTLEHRCFQTATGYGFGSDSGQTWGNNVYSVVEIFQFT